MQELHVHLSFGQFFFTQLIEDPQNTPYLNECHNVFGTKLLIEDTDSVSASPSGDGTDCHFT